MSDTQTRSDEHNEGNDQTNNSSNQIMEFRFLIDNSSVGGLIGKGGANVKRVRDESGAHVSVLKSDTRSVTERIMILKGSVRSVSKAAFMLGELLIEARAAGAENRANCAADQAQLRLLVHKQAVGAIIGKAGAVIKDTQNETGARVQVSNEPLPNSTEKSVSITGTPSALEAAFGRIAQQLCENPLKPGTRSYEYNPNASSYGGYVPPSQHALPLPIGNVAAAVGVQPSTQKIAIPTVCAGCVIGKNGSVIRDLRAQSQTNISISDPEPDAPNERVVTLTGTAQGIQHAVYLIRQLVEQYQPHQHQQQQQQQTQF